MKNITCTLLFLFIGTFCITEARAQSGWKWGLAGARSSVDMLCQATDKAGNVFTGSQTLEEDYGVYGTDTVFNPAYAPGAFYDQMVITKNDSSGHFLWAMASYNSNGYPINMVTDTGGNLYVLGYFMDTFFTIGSYTLTDTFPSSYEMLFLTKFSPSGTVLWTHNIEPNDTNNVTYGETYGAQLGIDGAGNLYVSGNFNFPSVTIGTNVLVNTDPTGLTTDDFIAKFDRNGNNIWAKRFGFTDIDVPIGLAVTKSGNIYITGIYYSDTFTADTFYAGSTFLYSDTALGTGSYLVKFDSAGSLIWAKNTNPQLGIESATTDADENFYVCGSIYLPTTVGATTLISNGGDDAFWAKFDSSGNALYGVSGGGTDDEDAYNISVDSLGNVLICGPFGSSTSMPGYTMNFGSGTISYSWSYTATDALYVAVFNNAGNYLSGAPLPSGGDDYAGITADNHGSFYVCGDFLSQLLTGPDTLMPSGFESLFIAKYRYDTSVCDFMPPPVAAFTCTGTTTVSFTYTGSTSYDSLRWDFGDGTTSTVTNPVHTYTTSVGYNACVTLFSSCLSEGGNTYCHEVDIPNALAEVATKNDITVSPNPATNELTITAGDKITAVIINNYLGQTVYRGTYNADHITINLADFPVGIYLMKINDSSVKKFVKE